MLCFLSSYGKNKTEYVKRKTCIREYSNGGINALDFQTMNRMFKINWIKQCLANNTCQWFYIPNLIFDNCGGLKFLLSCDFKCEKLPIKLANFHKQALQEWCMAFKHNFSPHTYIIQNNQYILLKKKSVYKKNWVASGIVFISDILKDGSIYQYEELLQEKGLDVSRREFNEVVRCISPEILTLVRNALMFGPSRRETPSLMIGDRKLLDCNEV